VTGGLAKKENPEFRRRVGGVEGKCGCKSAGQVDDRAAV